MSKLVDLIGRTYGRLTVISRDGDMYGKVAWVCKCQCGAELRVSGADLKSGNKSSCGCLKIEVTRLKNYSHGLANSAEYKTWRRMKERCYNRNAINYSDYGGRGITVCQRWRESFKDFYNDMGPRPGPKYSIERKNVNAGYSKGNCRWATRKEQDRNKRNNRHVFFEGRCMTLVELAELLDAQYDLVYYHLRRCQWSVTREELIKRGIEIPPMSLD